MEIMKTSRDVMTVPEIYGLTRAVGIGKLSDKQGEVVEINDFVIFVDYNSKGDKQTILTVKTASGVYATNSRTFIEEFDALLAMYAKAGETLKAVKVVTGKSKAGRTFITCEPVEI